MFTGLHKAARRLLNRPGYSALSIGVLGLGLGSMLLMLSLVNGLMLEPLPFPQPDRLVAIGNARDGNIGVGDIDSDDWLKLMPELRSFKAASTYEEKTISISRANAIFKPKLYNGTRMGHGMTDLLGVRPMLGRAFSAADDRPGAPLVVLLGARVWQQDFAGEADIAGRVIRVDGEAATIIGVMPIGFAFPFDSEVFVPRRLQIGEGEDIQIVARLNSSVDVAQARAELETVAQTLGRALSGQRDDRRLVLKPLTLRFVDEMTRRFVWVMLATSMLVMVLACVNVANLELAQHLTRRRELAICGALGASRTRLLRDMLVESLLKSTLATLIGLVVANYGGQWILEVFRANGDVPAYYVRFAIDVRMLGFGIVAALLTTLLAGLIPALRASRINVQDSLRDGDKGSSSGGFARLVGVLVVAEVALTVMLLVSGGTFIRGLDRVLNFDFGTRADPRTIVTSRIRLYRQQFPSGAAQVQFFERVVDRMRRDPEVLSASVATALPGTSAGDERLISARGAAKPAAGYPTAVVAHIDDYFADTYQLQLLTGRLFDQRDQAGSERVVVVDARLAEWLWPGRDPLGQTLLVDPQSDTESYTVIGVVAKLHLEDADDPQRPVYLLPLRQHPQRVVTLAVRIRSDASAFASKLAAAVSAEDADTPVYRVQTQQKAIEMGRIGPVLLTQIFSGMGLLALALAAAGLYGVLAFGVEQRTREIGIRRAIGASRREIAAVVSKRALWQVGAGLLIGLGLGLPWSGLLADPLMQTQGYDGLVFGLVVVLVLVVALLASLIPLRRALRVDPMIALRYE
ncbi:MAG: ADOP family duplicated permease [Xanthomonadaceae bacterium]|nr:ADOP family duplicated permease [Xanthomonadaceae bacterium]MDP2183946.1 ADOP family duplicated permease [Xanthomonadales bacterium]MDZ4116513.1 ADOP family duplicated permease [Xanthomonadaceae bacterium]MDZ4378733.1 ADOP family duplicated permease [Xanthomonadaceae bacterium]